MGDADHNGPYDLSQGGIHIEAGEVAGKMAQQFALATASRKDAKNNGAIDTYMSGGRQETENRSQFNGPQRWVMPAEGNRVGDNTGGFRRHNDFLKGSVEFELRFFKGGKLLVDSCLGLLV